MSIPGAWHARNMIGKCSDVISYLEGAISSQQSGIEMVDSAMQQLNTNLTANPDSALGFMITTFDDKEAEWYERTQNIISALNAGVDSLVLKKGEVEQKKEEWEEILRREEEENAGFLL